MLPTVGAADVSLSETARNVVPVSITTTEAEQLRGWASGSCRPISRSFIPSRRCLRRSLRQLWNDILDLHDAAAERWQHARAITADDWRRTAPETIREIFEHSARNDAARLQLLLRMTDEIIDAIDFGTQPLEFGPEEN